MNVVCLYINLNLRYALNEDFYFSSYRSPTIFIKFIPRVLYLVPIVNGISFTLYFLSSCCTHTGTLLLFMAMILPWSLTGDKAEIPLDFH